MNAVIFLVNQLTGGDYGFLVTLLSWWPLLWYVRNFFSIFSISCSFVWFFLLLNAWKKLSGKQNIPLKRLERDASIFNLSNQTAPPRWPLAYALMISLVVLSIYGAVNIMPIQAVKTFMIQFVQLWLYTSVYLLPPSFGQQSSSLSL